MSADISLPKQATIVEVGPRDGLQNVKAPLSVKTRVELINQLTDTGLKHIEAGSFVSTEKVPQMANTEQVYAKINKQKDCQYPVLVPNHHGLKQAITSQVNTIAIFGSASESFCQKNINCSVHESLVRFREIIKEAKRSNMRVRGYLSCVLGCPYEGDVSIEKTVQLAEEMINLGCYEVSLGDTIGIGTPKGVCNLLDEVIKKISINQVAVHFHNTYGQALANIFAALQQGVSVVDSSVAGLGGCPYAKGASGNVATEDVVYMLQGLGIKTGVNLFKLVNVSQFICRTLHCDNHSKVAIAMNRCHQGV